MNFSSAQKVLQTIRAGDDVETWRQENRVKVTDSANCVPPLDEETATKMGIKINVNWGGLMILLAHARRQYLTAFWSNQHFFKVSLPYAPAEHQSEWEAFITEEINKPLRNSLSYFELHRSRWSSVVSHGVGPQVWYKQDGWEPDFVAMSDLRIATDTTIDFKNLGWFAVRVAYTPMELLDKAFSGRKNNRWAKKYVADILRNYKELNTTDALNNYTWDQPEKIHENWKQNGGFYSGDAMPSIPLWHFYFGDNTDKDNKGWFMRVVAESTVVKGSKGQEFLWESDEPVAASWKQIIHCQYGDLSNDPPAKYHSIRSLGYALLEPEFYDNLTRCRLMQHIHDNFNIWLRTTDPVDKARAQVQEFSNLGMLRSGVSVVPESERHQIDAKLVEMGMAQMAQLKQQASASYTQQPDTGTQKEQTAFETSVKMQQVNAMLGGLLLTAFMYEKFADKEICRRFCLRKTDDPDIKRFQRRCHAVAKIPRRHLDVELWDVEPVTPLGMGNPTIAQAASQQLMQQRSAYDPTAQQEILHESTLVITGDARKAARWAPLGKGRGITEAQRDAMAMFGTLMTGVMVPPMEGLPVIDQIEAMIPLFASKIAMIEKRDNVGKPDEIQGLTSVYEYLAGQPDSGQGGGLVGRLAQNPEEKQRVKKYMDSLGQLWNQVKGLAQRGQEAAQKAQQNGDGHPDAAAIAKAQSTMMLAKVKAKTTVDKAKLTEKQSSERFVREQRREDAKALADIHREGAKNQMKSLESPGKE